jgi:hypothetical protein
MSVVSVDQPLAKYSPTRYHVPPPKSRQDTTKTRHGLSPASQIRRELFPNHADPTLTTKGRYLRDLSQLRLSWYGKA